jgi:hypothetical protein
LLCRLDEFVRPSAMGIVPADVLRLGMPAKQNRPMVLRWRFSHQN